MPDVSSAVNSFLDAYTLGDFDSAGTLLADGFSFSSPFLRSQTRDAFLESVAGMQPVLRGHRMLRQWTFGPDVSSIYELLVRTPRGVASIVMSEWDTVAEGRLTRALLVFDTAAFRAVVPAGPAG